MSPTSLSQPPFETLKTSTIGAYTFLTVDQPLGSSSPMDGINRITGNEVTVLPISKSNLTPQKIKGIQNETKISPYLQNLNSICVLSDILETPNELLLVYPKPCPSSFDESSQEISLMEYVKELTKLNEEAAKIIFTQIAEALFSCHERLIAHRDLKLPSLIINPETLHVRISDFHHSKILSSRDEKVTDRIGSPGYVAPEILSQNAHYSPILSDIWSLGVILYMMLCGRFPFVDQNPQRLFAKILQGQIEFPSHLSNEARSLLRCLLKVDPTTRISSSELFDHPWFKEEIHDRDQMVPTFE